MLDYPILYLSRYILENKNDYYTGLSAVTQCGSWESWLFFMLKAVEVTSNSTYDKINDIMKAKDAMLEYIQTETKFIKPEILVNALFTQPFTRVKHLENDYAENTARNYLDQLSTIGILEKRLVSGSAYYLNLELHRILADWHFIKDNLIG